MTMHRSSRSPWDGRVAAGIVSSSPAVDYRSMISSSSCDSFLLPLHPNGRPCGLRFVVVAVVAVVVVVRHPPRRVHLSLFVRNAVPRMRDAVDDLVSLREHRHRRRPPKPRLRCRRRTTRASSIRRLPPRSSATAASSRATRRSDPPTTAVPIRPFPRSGVPTRVRTDVRVPSIPPSPFRDAPPVSGWTSRFPRRLCGRVGIGMPLPPSLVRRGVCVRGSPVDGLAWRIFRGGF
mmetsp:Transcript_19709/g.41330  ORF Transcript_19709/g.41330 Transcript_19709/m.41330 type:complete len:234 (+) Transcript_19709:341-1042(+)